MIGVEDPVPVTDPHVAVYWLRVEPFKLPAAKTTSIWPLAAVALVILGASGISCAVMDAPGESLRVEAVHETVSFREQPSDPRLYPTCGVAVTLIS